MVCVYLDDVLVSDKTREEHLSNLNEVLTCLESAGLRLKEKKCTFCKPEVTCLGHIISADVLKPSPHKIKAVSESPSPSKISELKSFLGLVYYYGKFLPDSATRLAPLYKLLKHEEPWNWSTQQQEAFQYVKESLLNPHTLAYYDETKPIVMAYDPSPFGVGTVLSQVLADRLENPIAYTSHSLSPAE